MRSAHRKTNPKVRNGQVQKKNRTAQTRTCYNVDQPVPVIDRRRSGVGYRHVVTKRDLERFIRVIPDWGEISRGLDVLLIDTGRSGCMGWHNWGIVAICAWDREIAWTRCWEGFGHEHEGIFQKLTVPYEIGEEFWTVEWTPNLARAFLLTHVFIHELGHHHDRMTTKNRRESCRGEDYAEQYARAREDIIIDRYFNEFGF